MSEKEKATLEVKTVGQISGKFIIPSYQRGYRWGKDEIERLLEDLHSFSFPKEGEQLKRETYCLQPIVVREDSNGRFELIDGQQRLTTIYLIYKVMNKYLPLVKPKFSLEYEKYEKRKDMQQSPGNFLELVGNDQRSAELDDAAMKYIDCYFIKEAYQCIREWFKGLGKGENGEEENEASAFASELNKNFGNSALRSIKVLWYVAEMRDVSKDNAIEIFTRLNIGKIPLTDAELVKALFLSEAAKENSKAHGEAQKESEQETRQALSYEKQLKIATQWDDIERELHDEDFWYFLTTASGEEYQTRIELILELAVGKDGKGKDPDKHETFLRFMKLKDKKDEEGHQKRTLEELWDKEVLHTFLMLKSWFKDRELYHKIGYLIASRSKTIKAIVDISRGVKEGNSTDEKPKALSKDEFKEALDGAIKESIRADYMTLEYGKNNTELQNILLLFNVMSVLKNGDEQRFPFSLYAEGNWSLEHIYPQNPKEITKSKQRVDWLKAHYDYISKTPEFLKVLKGEASLEDVKNVKNLKKEMDRINADTKEETKFEKEKFENLMSVIQRYLPKTEAKDSIDDDDVHLIGNLALLQRGNNSALSNYDFAVKRNKLIAMDMNGKFIPLCTKNVFLKYYVAEGKEKITDTINLELWTRSDKDAYVKAIDKVLADYISKEEN